MIFNDRYYDKQLFDSHIFNKLGSLPAESATGSHEVRGSIPLSSTTRKF